MHTNRIVDIAEKPDSSWFYGVFDSQNTDIFVSGTVDTVEQAHAAASAFDGMSDADFCEAAARPHLEALARQGYPLPDAAAAHRRGWLEGKRFAQDWCTPAPLPPVPAFLCKQIAGNDEK